VKPQSSPLDWPRALLYLAAFVASEVVMWFALGWLLVGDRLTVLVCGTAALIGTALVFAPKQRLADPDIAGSAARYPILVRLILAGGVVMLWLGTAMIAWKAP
jgi:hypothetical protein